MYKYKFLNILESLSDKEFKSLGKFISSPFHNESKKMAEFYEFLKKYYNNHTFNRISTEIISDTIFKTRSFNSVKTRKLISDFNKLVEEYLIHISLDDDLIYRRSYFTSQLKKRKLDKYYDAELFDLKKLISDINIDSKKYFFTKLKITNDELSRIIHEFNAEKKYEKLKNLNEYCDNMHSFIKFYIYHLTIQNDVPNDSPEKDFYLRNISEFLRNFEKNLAAYSESEPRLFIYYFSLMLIITKKPEEIYKEMEEYVEMNRVILNSKDIEFTMYTILCYTVNEIIYGKYEKTDNATGIIKRIYDKGYLNGLSEISYIIFIQIISLALQNEETEFTEKFIWKYYPKLKTFKDDALNLAIASLRFEQGRCSEAGEHIKNINYSTYIFYLLTNTLQLKIYYEENSLKFIYPLVDSFKHFLKRNKNVPLFLKDNYNLFLNYLTRLTSLKKKNRKDIFRLEYELSGESNFYGKKWIEDKVNELIVNR